jgi:hypothetical protein
MSPAVVRRIREIAGVQLRRADDHGDAITAAILESAPVLSEDPSLSVEMHASLGERPALPVFAGRVPRSTTEALEG